VKIALVYPPTCDPTAPYLAVPMLTGFLRANGVEVVPIDANVEAFDALLRPAPLGKLRDKVERELGKLERRAKLDHVAQRQYLQLWNARGDALAAPDGIAEARATLKDEAAFFNAERYERAVGTVESALKLISAAHAPLDLTFSGYRTPFALTTPDEIAHDASEERDPFHDYVVHQLVPRLRAEAVDAIGISVCFPGQLQPAYAFALKLKAHLPDVHLTCGGPGITQLFIKLAGRDLERALGPFDTAVVFEGEHALLGLCRALDAGAPVRGLPNVVHRDPLLGAKYAPGHGSEDLRALPAPDFDGLALDLYLSPRLTLPYDPTRGCYWGKCTFCHYGLAEVGTASYRERPVELALDHLQAMADKYQTRWFYLSQDSVAPKTLLKLAEGMAERGMNLRWATDLKPERYLTAERAQALKAGGAVACALGVESAAPRVLELIDKGAPVSTVRSTVHHLAGAGIAVEAMCFTDFPTETYKEALSTLEFIAELKQEIALYIVGEFDLTEGALVAQAPEKFGVAETWHLDGDLLKTGLFYEESKASKRGNEPEKLDRALDRLGAGWKLRRYPWAGSLSTAHSVYWYEKFGPGVFKALAQQRGAQPFGTRAGEARASFDLDAVAESTAREMAIWHQLVRERRHVSRAAYLALARAIAPIGRGPRRYRFAAGESPVGGPGKPTAKSKGPRKGVGRRPSNASNSAG
jgi:anaerobic magnesium-protoporphyrin IX monomethyl ester cyclase